MLVGIGMMMTTLLLPDFGDTPEFIWLFKVWPSPQYDYLSNLGFLAAMIFGLVSVAAFVTFIVCYFKYSPKT